MAEEEKEQQQRQQFILPCMGRKRMKTERKTTELPEDIIHKEILTKLPAKYLMRFRLVCKSWKSLISNSDFVKSHLTRLLSYSYKDEDLIIVKKSTTDHGIFIVSQSHENHLPAVSKICHTFLGSVNGLVCMSSRFGEEFCIWNPATTQLVQINLPLHHSYNWYIILGGFTWDHLRNDYKVIVVCHEIANKSSRKLWIYSSNSASWTQVDIIDHSMLPDGSKYRPTAMSIMAPSTVVKGIPYWMSSNYLPGKKLHEGRFFHVYKFVVESNEFRSLPLLDSNKIGKKVFTIVDIKNRLVGLASNYTDKLLDIYCLDDEESRNGAWSKMYTMKPIIVRSCVSSPCLRYDAETLITSYAVPLSGIDRKIKETTELAEFHRCDRNVIAYFSYTPSLVCVQGMKSLELPLKMASPFCNWFSSF